MTTQTRDEGANGGATGATGANENAESAASAESTGSAAGSDDERSSAREFPPFAENIHGLVDDILEGVRSFTPVASVRYPRYDFVETPEAYLLVFDLPGVKRDEISVTTEGEDVVLSGERARPDWGEGSAIRRSERPHGGFRRALRMPADVRIDDIKARLEEGVLTVSLPRHTEANARKVDIEG
ncbi:MAG TPA: Hsp20/alpha crystallin family protein [Thermohalobaculum sp.]|nr:Hsp20/alpha crystallin family protein [Thermohalobaculum sp.]